MATNPKNLQVIVREANGKLKQLSFSADKKYVVNESVQITVLETNGSRIPQDILLKRKGNDLLIEVSGQSEVFEVQGFYSNKAVVMPDASFAGPALDLSQAIANSATGDIVWSAGATSGTSWTTLGAIGLGAIATAGGGGGGSSNNPAPLTIDTTSPELLEEDIVAELDGDPLSDSDTVDVDVPLIYTFTFNEDIDESSLSAADFSNAAEDGAAITIGNIIRIAPRVFTVEVTPTSAGSLQMQVNQGATIQDEAGNTVDTSSAIVDQEIIEVVGSEEPDTFGFPWENFFISVSGLEAASVGNGFSGVWIENEDTPNGQFDAGEIELKILGEDDGDGGRFNMLAYVDSDVGGEDFLLTFFYSDEFWITVANMPEEMVPELDWTIKFWDARMDNLLYFDVDVSVDIYDSANQLQGLEGGIDLTFFGSGDEIIIDMTTNTSLDVDGGGGSYMGIRFEDGEDASDSLYLVAQGGTDPNYTYVGLMNRFLESDSRLAGGYDMFAWVSSSSINNNLTSVGFMHGLAADQSDWASFTNTAAQPPVYGTFARIRQDFGITNTTYLTGFLNSLGLPNVSFLMPTINNNSVFSQAPLLG